MRPTRMKRRSSDIPRNYAVQVLDSGILLKRAHPGAAAPPRYDPHRDDYYIFGFIEEGRLRMNIDFVPRTFERGDAVVIRPGQVHHVVASENLKGCILMADTLFVGEEERSAN